MPAVRADAQVGEQPEEVAARFEHVPVVGVDDVDGERAVRAHELSAHRAGVFVGVQDLNAVGCVDGVSVGGLDGGEDFQHLPLLADYQFAVAGEVNHWVSP